MQRRLDWHVGDVPSASDEEPAVLATQHRLSNDVEPCHRGLPVAMNPQCALLGVPTPVITMALMARFSSQGKSDYARKLLALMRAGFGGHAVKKE